MQREILPAVSAIIFNQDREILMQKRKDTGKWCIISGHVEFGETVEGAIKREVFEEINVESEVIRLIGVYSSPDFTTYYYDDRIVQYIVSYFEVRLKREIAPGFSNSESEEIGYFSLSELPRPMDLINPNWLADALDAKASPFIR